MMPTDSELVAVGTTDPPLPLSGEIRLSSGAPQTILPPPYVRLLDQIHNLGKLSEGWDSYGASRISDEARTNAVRFVAMLVTHSDEPVPVPAVGPSVEGGVVLRWELGDVEVMVRLLSKGGEYFVAKRDEDELLAEGDIGRFEALVERLKRFLVS